MMYLLVLHLNVSLWPLQQLLCLLSGDNPSLIWLIYPLNPINTVSHSELPANTVGLAIL